MKTQEYIQSGILEAYLIGIASEEDAQEVELMQASNPRISTALTNLQTDIVQYFNTNAVPPPPILKSKLAFDDTQNEIKKWDFTQQGTNSKSKNLNTKENFVEVEFDNTHIKVHKYWRPTFIAVFVLSKIFLALALYFYFKSDSVEQENARLKQELEIRAGK
ncbi:MAG: hypothetical protein V4585_08665 [Bacteroidota bacterium]